MPQRCTFQLPGQLLQPLKSRWLVLIDLTSFVTRGSTASASTLAPYVLVYKLTRAIEIRDLQRAGDKDDDMPLALAIVCQIVVPKT